MSNSNSIPSPFKGFLVAINKGKWYTYRGGNSVKIGFVPFWKESTTKDKNFFLLEQILLEKGLHAQENKQDVMKVVPLWKMGKIH